MIFEWDHAKSERNRVERGLPFSYAVGIFADRIVEFEDAREDYGEQRTVALGRIEHRFFVVVFTDRAPGLRRIISARRAGTREAETWHGYVER